MAHRRQRRDYDGKIAGLYDLEETIGEGHFAVVKLARHVFTGEKVAVKVIDKNKLDEVSRSHLFQEVRCMKLVQHPNVVRLYEVIDTQTKLYLILELGDGGDMYDHIMKHENGLDENKARAYFRQIVEAISYCHRLHVVHRDLKPENVVFFQKLGIVKLTDFGFSNMFNPGKKLETSCGSLAYSAPEILLGDSYDAQAVDIWSLGVILFMLVCGKPPFQEANDSETLTMIMDCIYKFPRHVSEECKQLISSMLKREPGHRAKLVEIEEHQWLKVGARDVVHHHLPLISREHISDDDHNNVIDKMVEGNIATKEEILESLEKDSYDHITATYYLLAERRLRRQHQELLNAAAMSHVRKHSAPLGGKPHLEPLALSPRKRREIKKTKTAPVPQKFAQMLTLPESPSAGEGEHTTDYFTSLTTSMTLDRRAKLRTPVVRSDKGSMSPGMRRLLVSPPAPEPVAVPRIVEPAKPAKKKHRQFSKIAILSSFFERKAADAAWTGPLDKKPGGFWRLPGFGKKKPNVHFKKEESRDDAKLAKPKSLVHSLLSPPGVHPSPSTSKGSSPAGSPVAANRKYSLIKEESIEDDGESDYDDMDIDAGIESVRISKSVENLLDDSPSHTSIDTPVIDSDQLVLKRPLLSVASSPQLLNQICEENESEEEDNFISDRFSSPRLLSQRNSTASPEVIRKFEARKKRRGTGSRGTSCSSSDASDTDDTEGRSRKDKLKHKFAHRRDSSDHSSDTDGGPGSGGFGRGYGEGSGSGNGPSNDGDDRGGGGGKKGGKGGSPRNSRRSSHKGKQNNLNITIGGDIIPLSLIERTNDTKVCSGISNISLNSRTSKSSLKYVLERDEDIQESDVEDNDKENDDTNHIEQIHKKVLHRNSNGLKDLHRSSNGLKDFKKVCDSLKDLNKDSNDMKKKTGNSINGLHRDSNGFSICDDKAQIELPDVSISPCSPDCDLRATRPCPNGKLSLKMDINSNAFCKTNHSQLTPVELDTKCCSLI